MSGQSDPEKTVHYSSPNYSPGPRPNKNSKPDNNPAPGYYDPTHNNRQDMKPGYTFGHKRSPPRIDATPAPGYYDPDQALKKVESSKASYSYSFGEKHHMMEDAPAAGYYETDSAYKDQQDMNHPSYTFGHKRSPPKVDANPAPGYYDPDQALKNVEGSKPRYSFAEKHHMMDDTHCNQNV
ncbi:ciliary microtubule associated protein 1A isoform X1 [Parasteatoda tepidariorum]|uniref:ciliary microtubule associated protein 1A isoform X1 n=1 Tax=Parasteatoda tepidariorum TaxID=114398 RepID=UPI00077FE2DA|nr:uncharacterized protein LOC107440113 isoform X1 [Parasteatoda tepidariorum]XP_042909568.1 uncharacterized protein LOC107440113 isoform X1 [Parasteatoda tepidariorum]